MRQLLLAFSIGLGLVACGTSSAPEPTAVAPVATAAPEPEPTPESQGVFKISVGRGGFLPSTIKAKVGQPVILEFTRTTDETCATKVVFPELKITKSLPLDAPVSITVPSDVAHTYGFQCSMAMDKGTVVIE